MNSKNTYNVKVYDSADNSNSSYEINKSSSKGNDIVVSNYKDTKITSNANHNIFFANYTYGTSEAGGKLTYSYGGGSDIVFSQGDYSADEYIVKDFDKNTKLFIMDSGSNGTDFLTVEADSLDNIRLFFNVNAPAKALPSKELSVSIVSKDNLNKSNLELIKQVNKLHDYRDILANKGVVFNYNTEYDYKDATTIGSGIETVTVGETTAFEFRATVDAITQNVQAWLGNHTKYSDVYDVLNKGSKSDINAVLNIYKNQEIGGNVPL